MLVKAGFLPRLGAHVLPVYIEASQNETGARMLNGLRKACPELSRGSGLVDSLASLRRGRILPPERKVLLVLDQFEQWLHAKRSDENTKLVAALRHCDGGHLQAVVLVRDDFWLAASRFMRDLEVRLLEGENSVLVDLFDPRHAKKVLPESGTGIKGQMRSHQELLEASGYANRTRDFDDPIGVARAICQPFDDRFDHAAEERMRLCLAENPRGKHGPQRYDLAEFGLDAATINHRFASYREWLATRVSPDPGRRENLSDFGA
jgi:Novel STAND NTPase 1